MNNLKVMLLQSARIPRRDKTCKQARNKLKNKLAMLLLAGSGILSFSNSNSQNFVKNDTLIYDYVKYKINLFEKETQEIIALDTNQNKINDQVIKKTINKKFLGKKGLIYQKWIDSNEDKIFDEYQLIRKDFNFFGKEKYNGEYVSKDTAEINKFYTLPIFDGKKFYWKNNTSGKSK